MRAWSALDPMREQPGPRHPVRVGLRGDGLLQHGLRGLVQLLQRLCAQPSGLRLRVNLGLEQDLIGVDIADSRDRRLIHQNRLDGTIFAGRLAAFGKYVKNPVMPK